MAKKKVLYADVVTDESPIPQNSAMEKHSSGVNNAGKAGKDEESQTDLESMANKLAEDPYITESERRTTDDGAKEKQAKVEDEPGQKSQSKSEQTQKEVDVLVARSDKILLQAKGMFPFDFFPDTLTIDANKVNIIIKTFFATETATSVLLKEIMDVRVESSLFLGKLIIDYGPHPMKISTVYVPALKKSDALKAKEIIEGMLVLYRAENIDTTKLKPEETMEAVKEIGKIEERE